MPNRKAETTEDEVSEISIGHGQWRLGARGRHLTHLAYVSVLALIILLAIWAHEQSTLARTRDSQAINIQTQKQVAESLRDIREAQDSMKDEIVYVLTRDEAQRKQMNLQMPDSLRKRVNRQ